MRHDYQDTARGIGILLVVYGHSLRGLVDSHLIPNNSFGTVLMASDYVIYTFHMPLFFLLSGFHAPASIARSPRAFLFSKLEGVVYPYILWSLAQAAILSMASGYANHNLAPSDIPSVILHPIGQFWFLYALLICQIVATLFVWNGDKGFGRWVGSITYIGLAILACALVGNHSEVPVLRLAFYCMIFYGLGMLVAPAVGQIVERGNSIPIATVTGFIFVGLVIVAKFVGRYDGFTAIPAAIAGIALVLLVSNLLCASGRGRWLQFLGIASMPIYLMHIFGTAGARAALLQLHITQPAVHLAVGVAAGVAFPLVVWAIARRLGIARAMALPSIRSFKQIPVARARAI